MSLYYLFASDTPLKEAKNPYIQLLSVNEAKRKGLDVDTSLFENDFDYDKPEVILYVEKEENFNYPNIYLVDKNDFCNDVETTKQYMAVLESDGQREYIDVIMSYIKDHLTFSCSIELWKVWIGTSREVFTPTYIKIDEASLTKDVLYDLFCREDEYVCLEIHRKLP